MLSDMACAKAVDAARKALNDNRVHTVPDAIRAVTGLMLDVLIAYMEHGATEEDIDNLLAWLKAEVLKEVGNQ
jgi:hypothetical protein